MNKFLKTLSVVAVAFAIAGCEKDDLKSDLTGVTEFSFTNDAVKSYAFTVDQDAMVIQNADSLPKGTDVSKLVANFTTVHEKVIVKVGTQIQVSGVTANDYANPLKFDVYAENGTLKSYTVKVNVAKIDPNWQFIPMGEAGFPAYTWSSVVYYKGTYVMANIQSLPFGSLSFHDYYTSKDLKTWTLAPIDWSAVTNPNQRDRQLPYPQSALLVANDNLWQIGGLCPMAQIEDRDGKADNNIDNWGSVYNWVRKTQDVKNWAMVNAEFIGAKERVDTIFSPRANFNTVSFNNKLWVIGGHSVAFGSLMTNSPMNDVWSSADGVRWKKVKTNDKKENFPPRTDGAVVSYKGKMWMIGGALNTGSAWAPTWQYKNDIWTSTDGVTWTEVASTKPFSARSGQAVFVYDDKLYMIGGQDANGKLGDFLVSEDEGKTWNAVADKKALPASFTPRSRHSVTVSQDGKIAIIGGFKTEENKTDVPIRDVWSCYLNRIK